MKLTKKLSKFLPKTLSLLLGLSLVLVPNVKALEVVISENGSGSESVTTVGSTDTTNISQTNNAQVSNDVNANSNTGDSESSGNTGKETTISTGNTSSDVNVENNLNSSFVTSEECCSDSLTAEITSNGSDSANEINIESVNLKTVTINQNATIENFVSGTINTGGNTASNNSGGVSISTGNIIVAGSIINDPVNTTEVNVSFGSNQNLNALISNNGSGSKNLLSSSFFSPLNVSVMQNANFKNSVNWDLNTGENTANDNTGGVTIKTGDIDFNFLIKNLANLSAIDVKCCRPPQEEEEKPEVPRGGAETPGGENKEQVSGDGGGPGVGQILPEAAATSAGGPGIIGLSDTSSENAQALFFWIALAMIVSGGKIATNELFASSPKKR